MLHKTIYAMPIVILTMGAVSAQMDPELQDIKGGQNSSRTELQKKNDRDIDRAYQSMMKRVPNAEKKKSDPWGDARSAPPAAGKNKQQLRIVSGEKTVSCNADEVLVSVICSEGAPDGVGCSAGSPTGLCRHK
jgi:hypothetical protein